MVFPKLFRNFPLDTKGKDVIDQQFVEFEGTLKDAIYVRKKSPSKMRAGGSDNQLLELLVYGSGEEKCSILRYRVRRLSPALFDAFLSSLPLLFHMFLLFLYFSLLSALFWPQAMDDV